MLLQIGTVLNRNVVVLYEVFAVFAILLGFPGVMFMTATCQLDEEKRLVFLLFSDVRVSRWPGTRSTGHSGCLSINTGVGGIGLPELGSYSFKSRT